MAQKQVRVRYRRTMGIGKDRQGPGFETMMDVGQAEKWARNGRIEIIATGKEKARPAGAADPSKAPPSGSPAGSGAVSSSSLQGRPPGTSTGKKRGRPPKAKAQNVDPFG